MHQNPHVKRLGEYIKRSVLGRLFLDKKFFTYTCVGVFVSVFSIFLLWVFIDLLHIETVRAGTLATVIVFLLRYVLLTVFKIV